MGLGDRKREWKRVGQGGYRRGGFKGPRNATVRGCRMGGRKHEERAGRGGGGRVYGYYPTILLNCNVYCISATPNTWFRV